jgi:predicted aspartyl protease
MSATLKSRVALESALTPVGRKEFKAIWDTGATLSVIRPEVAEALSLKSVSTMWISTPTDERARSSVYLVNIYLPNQVKVIDVQVAEGIPAGCDMLIGMDIITLGDFAVTNFDGHTTFSFRMPSLAEIDFCKHSYLLPVQND